MADEGFHEIQLNGKQLVFLFMALTVFSVVVFLSGVMVGRGVRAPHTALAAAAAAPTDDPTLAAMPPPRAAAAAINAERPPVSTQESLTYAERLEAPLPPPETLDEPVVAAAAPVDERPTPPVERGVDPAPAAATSTSFVEPPGNGFAVQVGAYPRGTADVIAQGLAAKGFPSFITPRERGLFAVRVGKYPNRREAEAIARRLEQDEQFNKPWVTR